MIWVLHSNHNVFKEFFCLQIPLLGFAGGLPANLSGVSLNLCLPYWKSQNFTCSEKWSPEKYILDDSLMYWG